MIAALPARFQHTCQSVAFKYCCNFLNLFVPEIVNFPARAVNVPDGSLATELAGFAAGRLPLSPKSGPVRRGTRNSNLKSSLMP
jgi:hypothetical protein